MNELRRSERIIRRNVCEPQTIHTNNELCNNNNNNHNKTKSISKNRNKCEKCLAKLTKYKYKHKNSDAYDKNSKLCVTCFKLVIKTAKKSSLDTNEDKTSEKKKYLVNCSSFAQSMVELCNDSDAERLYCPNFKHRNACACVQKYVIGNGLNLDESNKRAKHLLNLLKRSKHLSEQKCYSLKQKGEKVGLGNGHKRSKEFETHVVSNRNYLRKDLHFCEKATQKVLFYSNNFLHKKLKTGPNSSRIERIKGRTATDKLINISLLSNESCCRDKCVKMAETHPNLIASWRQRASSSQLEARRVLSEMLTPTQANKINCFKFISLVTGSSLTTINSVNKYMTETGGAREPIQHGLKKYSQQIASKNKQLQSDYDECNAFIDYNNISKIFAINFNEVRENEICIQLSDDISI